MNFGQRMAAMRKRKGGKGRTGRKVKMPKRDLSAHPAMVREKVDAKYAKFFGKGNAGLKGGHY